MKSLWYLSFLLGSATAARLGKHEEEEASFADQLEVVEEGELSDDEWAGPTEQRRKYVKSKMDIEHRVVDQFIHKAADLQEVGLGNPKVAFLFLTMSDFPWLKAWEAFFQDAWKKDYSIYVHRAALKDAAQRQAQPLPLAKYGAIEVPWVQTGWCALFGVEVASLFHAMQDPANLQFVFVSDSSVPLKPFAYVHKELALNSPETSKICLASGAYFNKARTEFAKQEASQACVFRDFLRGINPRAMKHHQWAVFSRAHAKMIIQYAKEALKIYEDVWLQAAPDIKNAAEGCSDEAVPLIALLHALDAKGESTGNTWLDLTRLGVEQNCLTFVRWRNCFVGTQLDLSTPFAALKTVWNNLNEVLNLDNIDLQKSALKRELNGFPHAFDNITGSYLETLMDQNFMFARKFHTGAQVLETDPDYGTLFGVFTPFDKAPVEAQPLAEVLPRLWSRLDLEKAQKSPWSRLEKSGKPGPLKQPNP